jgi:ATP phosphoribosyltransferase
MINIALPKGRLGEKAYQLFEKVGYGCPDMMDGGRRLLFENSDMGVCYFWVKPSDAAIYVARGAADLGVCGKDVLEEQGPDVYELLDLNIGRCRMAVAAKNDYIDDPSRTLRVATKFPNIARAYYEARGRAIDIIRLSGSIELAPLLKLSDVIVDIVETGATLKENNLAPIEWIFDISARLIAGKAAFQFKQAAMLPLIRMLREGL